MNVFFLKWNNGCVHFWTFLIHLIFMCVMIMYCGLMYPHMLCTTYLGYLATNSAFQSDNLFSQCECLFLSTPCLMWSYMLLANDAVQIFIIGRRSEFFFFLLGIPFFLYIHSVQSTPLNRYAATLVTSPSPVFTLI